MAQNLNELIDVLNQRVQSGFGRNALSRLYGSTANTIASTAEGQKSSGKQAFTRFGSPAVDAYMEKLERSRLQSAGKAKADIGIANEAEKSKALSELAPAIMQKEQLEAMKEQRWFDALNSVLGLGASALGGGLFDLMGAFKGGGAGVIASTAEETDALTNLLGQYNQG